MKVTLHIVTILIALNAASAQTPLSHFKESDSSYFPLSIGNVWTFSNPFSPRTERISDTATVGGKLYYGLTIWPPYVSDWLRSSNDSVFVTRPPYDTTEYLLFDFQASVGDTVFLPSRFGCDWGTGIILAGKEDTVSTPAGTFTHCLHFRHINQCNDAGLFDSWYARGVGRIKYVEDNYGGIMTYDLASFSLATGVVAPIAVGAPDSYILFESYPNPFNAQTTIRFHLAGTSSVSLEILDLLGRQVALLARGQMHPGDHQAVLNARNLSSGVYFVLFRADDNSQTKKLILQK